MQEKGIYQFGYQSAEKKKDKLIFLTNDRSEVIFYGFEMMNAIESDLIRTKNEHQCISFIQIIFKIDKIVDLNF